MYDYLLENGLLNGEPNPDDPYYDEWVQFQLNREGEYEEETDDEKQAREETLAVEEDEGIQSLNAEVDINKFVDGARQNEIIQSFISIPNFEMYTQATIDGGVYNETVRLKDAILLDNNRALRQFATDKIHKEMVRSQYKN